MAVITNKCNLPIEVYNALCANRYSGDDDGRKTDYSATKLIAPIQQTVLKQRYPDAEESDAIDKVWSMFGSIAHTLLEEHGSEDALTESRFYTEVLGKSISGQVDHVKDGIITDYKTTSAFKITKRSYSEWEQQLNIYAWLARLNGIKVRSLRVIAIIRDWSARDAEKFDYPSAPIVEIPLTLWSMTDATTYVTAKVSALKIAEEQDDMFLPLCTMEEMWQSESVYALMKEGRKTAVKLFKSNDSLFEHLVEADLITSVVGEDGIESVRPLEPYYVVKREGERRKCNKYCAVKNKCQQNQSYIKAVSP